MDTKRYTPEIVVQENLKFSIPLYQRLFAWEKPQVEGLMVDLLEHFQKKESPYYLGMLSCVSNKGRYDLIDGQQRFTVMTLMGIVLRDYYPEWNKFLDKGQRVSFVARTKDKDYITARIAGVNSLTDSNKKMESAISVVREFIDNKDHFSNEEEKIVFAGRVYKFLSFYFSSLPQAYLDEPTSLNKYFEAMNSHGKSLEQHEILKVELLKSIPDDDNVKEHLTKVWNIVSEFSRPIIRKASEEETLSTYRQRYDYALMCCRNGSYDKAFDTCIQSIDMDDNESIENIQPQKPENVNVLSSHDNGDDKTVISFPEFLLLTLDITLSLGGKYSFYRKDLITAFKENRLEDIEAFYNNLLFYRLLLDYYVVTKEDGKIGNRYDLLYNTSSDSIDARDKECVIQYQSMLYVSQTPFYEWLKPLLIHLKEKKPNSCREILGWIKDTDDSYRRMPESVEAFDYNHKVDRYWFWRLDYYLWEHQDEFFKDNTEREIVNDYIFRADRSIEHLHPQHQEHNEKWEESEIHTFGNLAMISQSFNSEQSDDPVTVKFARILDQANNHNLQSVKLYKMYLDAEKSPGGWTVERMRHHEAEMFELLNQSYKR